MKYDPIVNLCVDSCRGRVANFAAGKEHYSDEAIRAEFNKILGGEGLNARTWRRYRLDVFEIVEKTMDQVLPDAWNTSPFYNAFVEVKNGALGDKNEFVVDAPSTLVVSKFAGGHWTTDRQKLPGKRAFSVDTAWYQVRIYDELDRFLRGTVTISEMFAALRKAFQDSIDSSVYTSFVGASAYLPTQFNVLGPFDKAKMHELIQRVSVANQSNVRIAGTSAGLSMMDDQANTAWLSDAMKDEKYTTGRLSRWDGYARIEIPQTFRRGTYDFQAADNEILVLPENYRPIKLYFEGETRSRDLASADTYDQTMDYELQTKLGIGVVFEGLFGKFTIE